MNQIPILGWLLDLVLKASLAVPFWLCWEVFGIGAKFFYFLPAVFFTPGFWSIVGLFICLGILNSFSPFRSVDFNS